MRKWIVLFAVCLGAFVVSFNTTAIMNAIPLIRQQLHLSISTTEWAINAYMLGSATFIMVGGKLGDIISKRILFYSGGILFMIASVIVAVADNSNWLIIGRTLQGFSVAFLIPMTMSIAKINFPEPAEQKMAIGIWSGLVSLGFAAGPLVGGIFIAASGWRLIFWMNIPLLFIAMLILFCTKRKQCDHEKEPKPKIDFIGNICLSAAVFLVSFALTEANGWGWTDPWVWVLLVASAVMFIVFYKVEQRVEHPTIHFAIFKNKVYLLGTILIFLMFYTLLSIMYFYNLYIQNDALLDYNAFWAGLSFLPTTICIFVLSFIAPKMNIRYGYKLSSTLAFFSLFVGFMWLYYIGASTGYAILWIPLLLIGLGLGCTFPCFSGMALSELPTKLAGEGAGMISLNMYLTSILSTSIGSIFYVSSSHHVLKKGFSHLTGISQQTADTLTTGLTSNSLSLQQALQMVPSSLRDEVTALAKHAGMSGFNNAMLIAGLLSLIGIILCNWFIPNRP